MAHDEVPPWRCLRLRLTGNQEAEVWERKARVAANTGGLAAPAAPQLALRKKMTEQLIIEESKHEALEEMYFWPVVRDHLPDGDTLADQATGQEQEAKLSAAGAQAR